LGYFGNKNRAAAVDAIEEVGLKRGSIAMGVEL
jgi:hypothetical protein